MARKKATRRSKTTKTKNGGALGFEATLWAAADLLVIGLHRRRPNSLSAVG